MSVSLEYLERCAAETGFQVGALEKVVRLAELAADVGRQPLLKDVLVLKGGTALNLGFGPPSRLSVDLDFNYIGSAHRTEMLAARPRVEEAVGELGRRAGYRAQHSADAFAGRKIFLHYRSVIGPEDRIEIDLNFLFRVPLVELDTRELWQPGELDRPIVKMVGSEELLAGKLLALLERCAPRDAWDAANLAPELTNTLAARAFRSHFVAIAGILDHPLPSYGRGRLERRLTQRTVEEMLAPMLARGARVSAADLLEHAWSRLQPLLVLEPEEQQFVDDLDRGLLRPELLFPADPTAADRLSRHPALLWKARNARAHRAGTGMQSEVEGDEAP